MSEADQLSPRAEQPGPPLQRGAAIGRYVVLGWVGRGTVGDVYAAYDPELDRKVAVKVLRPRPRADGNQAKARSRLLREAQATAKLSHPNVVVIFDVGTFGDTVFLAMEFIDGDTVGRWRDRAGRGWKEVLRVFLAAGRGLAAAHGAGLVHHGFKPDNVMVGRDGTVRVMDFGLAETTAGSPDDAATDPHMDQLNYCIALYVALYGVKPLAMGSGGAVPSWIRKILLRGLAPAPEMRYASMDQLLAALDKDPSVARRRWARRAGVGALAIGLVFTVGQRLHARRTLCLGGAAKLAGIWEAGGVPSPRKVAIRAAFTGTGKTFANHAFTSASEILDRYVSEWTAIYGEACQATSVRGVQSAEVLDLRMSCLSGRLESVRALTDVFLRADAQVVEKAASAAEGLAPLERCSDLILLRALVKPPDDPTVRARVQQMRRRLAEVKALGDAGRMADAQARAQPLLQEARVLGYLPVTAEALTRLGWVTMGRPTEAEPIISEAAWSASASGDDELLAEAAIAQVLNVGFQEGEPARAQPWIRIADATLTRIGGHAVLRAWLINNQGAVLYAQGRYEESIKMFGQAMALKEKTLGADASDVATSLGNMGDPMAKLGRFQEALVLNQRALQILEANGEDQQDIPVYVSTRGEYLNALGHFGEAEVLARRALALWELRVEAENAYVAFGLTVLGRSYLGRDRPREAVAPLIRAYDLRSRLDPDPARLAETAFALAQALWRSGRDRPRALALAAEAARAYAKTPDTGPLAETRLWLTMHASARASGRASE
jgi:tetratricopeptide (TPR) repeat protein/tRNA A-37 threonylcarbamoyl transferase component Bud32